QIARSRSDDYSGHFNFLAGTVAPPQSREKIEPVQRRHRKTARRLGQNLHREKSGFRKGSQNEMRREAHRHDPALRGADGSAKKRGLGINQWHFTRQGKSLPSS